MIIFLLNDSALHIHVLDQQPKTVDECLIEVTPMSVIAKAVQLSVGGTSSLSLDTPPLIVEKRTR